MQTRSAVAVDGGVQPRTARDRAAAGWPAACAVALAWFALVLPLLGRAEWEDDMEHLTVATALELRWTTGHAMTPTLQGETRLNKPPLMPWLTAACVSERTLRDMQSPDEGVRRAGRSRLAFEARLPAHVMSALLLLAVYGLGRVVVSARCGLRAAVACATMFLFARYMRFETFDAPLALFTAVAQLCLAHWVFENRRWLGGVGGGLALGLGVLSKGPVILLFACAPLLVYLPLARRWERRSFSDDDDEPDVALQPARPRGPWLMPALVLIVFAVVPILPWVFAVVGEAPGAWARWVAEVTRKGTTAAPSGKWYTYAEVIRLALPWTPWVVAGGVLAVIDWRRGREVGRRAMVLLAWVIVPIVVMSLARDRKPHYLLPLVAPLAVLAGRGLGDFGRPSRGRQNDVGILVVVTLHWLSLIGLIVSVWRDRRSDSWGAWANRRWPELTCMAAMVAGVAAGVFLARRSRVALVAATAAVIFAIRWLEGVRPPYVPPDRAAMRSIADEIWRVAPAANVYIHDTAGGAALAVQRGAELQVLMGRVVRWTPNPAPPPPPPQATTRPATTDAAIFVVHRTKKATTRNFDAPGWTVLAREAARDYPVKYELLVPAESAAAANADPTGD